ncbi:MAG: discoidin domain-containing protein, partial [Umezawaea sp.]
MIDAPRDRHRLALVAVLVSLLAGFLTAATTPAVAADVVVSQNKPVTASSSESAGTSAAAAVDGNDGTRWSSAFSADQWFQVDLGAATRISQVAVNWENAYAKAFTIQLSTDGSAYAQAYATTTGTGGRQAVPVTGTARYVRITLTQRALPSYGYSMWEFQVLGAAATSPIANVALVNNTS